jgi:hypothetical protein
MAETVETQKTYKEFMREVRAKQFGLVVEEPESITTLDTVDKPKKKKKEDE